MNLYRPTSSAFFGLVALIYLFVVVVLDHFIPGSPLMPGLLTIGLLLLSLSISQPWMLLWACVYSVFVITLFLNPSFYAYEAGNMSPPHEVAMYLRPFSFCCVALFAVIFNKLLNKHRDGIIRLHEIMMKFPDPLLVTDESGKIVECNTKLCESSSMSRDELVGLSFFDFFSPPDKIGHTIAKYLKIFDQETDPHQLNLTLKNQSYLHNRPVISLTASTGYFLEAYKI